MLYAIYCNACKVYLLVKWHPSCDLLSGNKPGMTGHVCNDLVPLELQIMRSDTRFGILRRVCKISSLLLSQSCYPQHGMLQICDLCDCISSQRRSDLFFFFFYVRTCWSQYMCLSFPCMQTPHLGLQLRPGSQATGCKHSGRFHQPLCHCNVTGVPLGAPQNVTNCGHLVQYKLSNP